MKQQQLEFTNRASALQSLLRPGPKHSLALRLVPSIFLQRRHPFPVVGLVHGASPPPSATPRRTKHLQKVQFVMWSKCGSGMRSDAEAHEWCSSSDLAGTRPVLIRFDSGPCWSLFVTRLLIFLWSPYLPPFAHNRRHGMRWNRFPCLSLSSSELAKGSTCWHTDGSE